MPHRLCKRKFVFLDERITKFTKTQRIDKFIVPTMTQLIGFSLSPGSAPQSRQNAVTFGLFGSHKINFNYQHMIKPKFIFTKSNMVLINKQMTYAEAAMDVGFFIVSGSRMKESGKLTQFSLTNSFGK